MDDVKNGVAKIEKGRRWKNTFFPTLIGGLIVNVIVLGILLWTGNPKLSALSQPVAFIAAGFVMGYMVGNFPILALMFVYFHNFFKAIIKIFTTDAALQYRITAVLILGAYLAIFFAATYMGAKMKKKGRPEYVM